MMMMKKKILKMMIKMKMIQNIIINNIQKILKMTIDSKSLRYFFRFLRFFRFWLRNL